MTTQAEATTPEITPAEPPPAAAHPLETGSPGAAGDTVLGPLHTGHGDTTIADEVVLKIAGVACREVSGLFAMSEPIKVQKGERQTAIDVSVVVDYGASIVEVSQAIRRTVIEAVEHGTGLEVTEVNIAVTDVHLPGDDLPTSSPAGDRA